MTPSKWRQQFTLTLPSTDLRGRVWIHACSVGEVSSVASLIHRLLAHGQQVHLTMVTRTGYAHAERLFGDKISKSWLPWDLPTLMPRFIKRLQPSMLLLCETEFWPGMLKTCQKQHIPVIGINTRISDRSFPKYQGTRFLWRRWLKPVSMFLAQSEQDAERLHAIGVEKSKIKAVGNLKFAILAPDVNSQQIRQFIDPSETRPILVIASTHEDEEAQIIPLLNTWKRLCPQLLTLIVPRHPERFKHVAKLLHDSATPYSCFTEERTGAETVILVDAMGELTRLYTIADLVFIGGSLAPIGGHNPLEAAVCGRGIISGPHVQNFRAVMQEMQSQGSAILVQDNVELESAVSRLLQHPEELEQLHAHAALFMQNQHEVLDRMWSEIEPFLNQTKR